MTLPFRRRSRPRGQARLALAGDIPGDGVPPAGEWTGRLLADLRTSPADGTTRTLPDSGQSAVIFEGANNIGVMPAGVVAIKDWGRDTQPLAWGRTQPETRADA